MTTEPDLDLHAGLDAEQRRAAVHGIGIERPGPLLVIAGAGTGKTTTLAHRVARLVVDGADPSRILLLTFTRRAAREMADRARTLVGRVDHARAASLRWAGTFHSVANRLLRLHGGSIGLDPAFTILDRSDAEDVLDLVRSEQGLDRRKKRFPKKSTCLAIYSRVVNSGEGLDETLSRGWPWCRDHEDDLRSLFRGFVEAKQARSVLDYDDLLLYWGQLVSDPALAADVARRFDHVLVDEYQDTNRLQARILLAMLPDGAGLTVVGDDAQSIYGFRAAEVRNILDFPDTFDPPATVVALACNYRSSQPILDAANRVINEGSGFRKALRSARRRPDGPLPRLVRVEDEPLQAEAVADEVLERREAGTALQDQAILFRAAWHSDQLEVELARRDIPFRKYGGLRFLDAAHVKDVLAVLRWAENPADTVAAFRVLQLLEGLGPATARKVVDALDGGNEPQPPPRVREAWERLVALLGQLRSDRVVWPGDLPRVRAWYEPELERLYENAAIRAADLDQLEAISKSFESRERFLSELTLDPPDPAGDRADDPSLDEDWITLSTIHSAKGREWNEVHVLHVVDGCLPSDMATGSKEEIEEERRLLYVAMTRARNRLTLWQPRTYAVRSQSRRGDRGVRATGSRFVTDAVLETLELDERARPREGDPRDEGGSGSGSRIDAAARIRDMW